MVAPSEKICAMHRLRWSRSSPGLAPAPATAATLYRSKSDSGGRGGSSPPAAGGGGGGGDAASMEALAAALERGLPGPGGGREASRLRVEDASRTSSLTSQGDWGFYDESMPAHGAESASSLVGARGGGGAEVPDYVLEDTLANQALWHTTCGARPRQPPSERAAFEERWRANFAESAVDYARGGAGERGT